jgi:uncharacterized protein (DUF433 family)
LTSAIAALAGLYLEAAGGTMKVTGQGASMFDRITSDAAILGGKPIIRGTRISVEMILEWMASGGTRDDIIRQHPHLTSEDIEQALGYAANATRNEVLLSAKVAG